jgi:hypothetical protein
MRQLGRFVGRLGLDGGIYVHPFSSTPGLDPGARHFAKPGVNKPVVKKMDGQIGARP